MKNRLGIGLVFIIATFIHFGDLSEARICPPKVNGGGVITGIENSRGGNVGSNVDRVADTKRPNDKPLIAKPSPAGEKKKQTKTDEQVAAIKDLKDKTGGAVDLLKPKSDAKKGDVRKGKTATKSEKKPEKKPEVQPAKPPLPPDDNAGGGTGSGPRLSHADREQIKNKYGAEDVVGTKGDVFIKKDGKWMRLEEVKTGMGTAKVQDKGKSVEDEGSPFDNDQMAKMRSKLLTDKEVEREGNKQTRILSDSTNLSTKGKFTQSGMEKEQEKMMKPYTEPPQCTNDEQCEKLLDEKGWTCDPKTNKCIPPVKKEAKPECTKNSQCEALYAKGWTCDEKTGECVPECTKDPQCETLHAKGWTCNTKEGICISPETKETKSEPEPKQEAKSEPEPKQEPQKEPVKSCLRHTYCDKYGIGKGRALDLNKDGICDTCGGKIADRDYQVITWPDPPSWWCPEFE